ncbi:DUF4132 domain-containing protein [Streptomyces zaomyceticus]|uniref:DUF4132 domain-containing protein n=1 Tax=Streptomyces zaomyceticus TaxID=68286 RepID=UPI00371D9929
MVGNTGNTVDAGNTGGTGSSGNSVGFPESSDAAGLRESALALHRRICRRSGEETAGRALDALARQELGWTTAESDLLLARLLGRDAEVGPHELLDSFTRLAPIALSAAEQAEDFDRARMRSLRGVAEHLRVHRDASFAALRDRMDALLRRPVPAAAGTVEFLNHCATLHRPRAPLNWRRRSAELLARAEGGAEVVRLLLEGIAAQPAHRVHELDLWGMGVPTLAGAGNTALVRGLLWAALDVDADWVVPLVGAVALHAGTGLGGSGGMCRSRPLATTAVAVLGACGDARGEEAVQWLGRLPRKVVNRAVAKGIAKALEEVSARSRVTPSMLRERGVATLGLDGRGVRETPLGAYTAELSVREPGTVALAFRSPEGRLLKTAPKEVREAHAEALKRVRAGLRELRTLVAAERSRLEEHLAAGTCWPAEDWQRYYVDHPVTGTMARALLWEVAEDDGERWTAGLPERTGGGWALAGADGTARPVGPGARLRLWHPLRAGGEELAEWRAATEGREEGRPFGQVFREVYPLTPAEWATGPSSHRFAGRVLRYGQARALMTARGWTGNHLGYFSDGWSSEMTKELPLPGDVPAAEGTVWRARLLVELVDEGASRDGVARLCATDRVWFERRSGAAGARGAWSEAALTDVPALALSEAFRDVDLFVQVASEGSEAAGTAGVDGTAGTAGTATSAGVTERVPAPN